MSSRGKPQPPLRFGDAIDAFVADMRREGRITTDASERSYRTRLGVHGDDVGNRDPRRVGRDDVKRTLARWPRANTQRTVHAVLASFYDWTMHEGLRPDNPARQVRRARRARTRVYRLTLAEVGALLDASAGDRRERFALHLGICAGLRSQELRGLRGRHFARPGAIWVAPELAKGGRERWVPVIAELQPIVDEIRATVAADHYVIPSRQIVDPPRNTRWRIDHERPTSAKGLWQLVGRVAERAEIAAHVHPHLLRHAFGDHVARHAGLRAAQAMLGHVSVETTESTYTGEVTLDELTAAVGGVRFRAATGGQPGREATTGIEPVYTALQAAA